MILCSSIFSLDYLVIQYNISINVSVRTNEQACTWNCKNDLEIALNADDWTNGCRCWNYISPFVPATNAMHTHTHTHSERQRERQNFYQFQHERNSHGVVLNFNYLFIFVNFFLVVSLSTVCVSFLILFFFVSEILFYILKKSTFICVYTSYLFAICPSAI